MNRKLVLSLSLVLLVGIVGFVSAKMTIISSADSIKSYDATIPISAGWNLVYGTFIHYDGSISLDSEIKKEDIKAVYFYSREENKYLQVYPTEKEYGNYVRNLRINGDNNKISYAMQSPYWVYSSKSGLLRYNLRAIYDDDNQIVLTTNSFLLSSGWNFVTPSSQFNDKTIDDLKGNCEIERAYGYDSGWKDWSKVEFREEGIGLGVVVKVKNDCKFGTVAEKIPSIPTIPN